MATVTLQGNPFNTNGSLPAVGSAAPDFGLVTKDLADVSLATYAGKKKLISIVAASTKIFNDRIKGRADVVALVVSADLPFAQGRFCGAEGIDNVVTLSIMRNRNFSKDYGMLMTDGPLAGITGRAVVVLDAGNKVVYTELVTEITTEPDYDAAIKALG